MELHALRLSLTEHDLNELLRKHLPPDTEVQELRVRLSEQGIHITGIYPFFIAVRFETLWELGVEQAQVSLRLASLKAMGVPGNIFKSAVMKIFEDLGRTEHWIRVAGDRVFADLEQAMIKHAVPARLHLKTISVQPGFIMLEGGH
jgi:hypothetical protein